MRKVQVTVSPLGEMMVTPQGFHGQGCSEFSRLFEGLGEVKKSELLPEYYEKPDRLKEVEKW